MQNIQIDLVKSTIHSGGYSYLCSQIFQLKQCFQRKDLILNSYNGLYSTQIVEVNMKAHQKRLEICSIVSDSIFFKFKDRKLAYHLVDDNTKLFLDKVKYLEMSNDDLLNFMCKRLIENEKVLKHNKSAKRVLELEEKRKNNYLHNLFNSQKYKSLTQ